MKQPTAALILGGLLAFGGMAVSATHVLAQDDTVAPYVKCSVRKNLLWPPNHRFVNVGLDVDANDDGEIVPNLKNDPLNLTVRVYADEEDEEATGDGRHSPDAVPGHEFSITTGNNQPLKLRRERKGNSDGRVYLVVVEARDAAGNSSKDSCTVVVPRNNSKAGRAKVNRQAADALAFYRETGELPSGFVPVGDGAVIGRQK